jgi:transcriptional repressor NrdR
MRCPACGCEDTKVVDSRSSENHDAIRRRRECESCGRRFTTYERREEQPLTVLKRDGQRETFDREKLMRGLIRATVKRNIEVDQLERLIDQVESAIRDTGSTQIASSDLGELVLKYLRELDKVAYIRFASVYREFKDVDEFTNELRRLHE